MRQYKVQTVYEAAELERLQHRTAEDNQGPQGKQSGSMPAKDLTGYSGNIVSNMDPAMLGITTLTQLNTSTRELCDQSTIL